VLYIYSATNLEHFIHLYALFDRKGYFIFRGFPIPEYYGSELLKKF